MVCISQRFVPYPVSFSKPPGTLQCKPRFYNHTRYDATWTNTRSASSYANVSLYTGRELDTETGLYYYRNRYYGPELGRFLSRDPIGYEEGSVNFYRYVGSTPLGSIDPFGLQSQLVEIGRVTIYPSPTGTFDFTIAQLRVRDPAQQITLGYVAVGFEVTDNAPPSVCTGRFDELYLSQAIQPRGVIAGGPPRFDSRDDPSNRNRRYPEYMLQRPGGRDKLGDSPYNPRFLATIPATFDLTICVICTTTLRCPKGSGLVVTVEQILGCISFRWRDRSPKTLTVGGHSHTQIGQTSSHVAEEPSTLWWEAYNRRQ